MMPENDLQQNNNDDEISLIDLFVVILKYRKVVIAITVLGIIAALGYYIAYKNKQPVVNISTPITLLVEGRMTVILNPRLARSGEDKIPGWFNSRSLINASLKEAGLSEQYAGSLQVVNQSVVVNQDKVVELYLKPGPWTKEQAEHLLASLLKNAETLAASYYAQYTEDLVSYFESSLNRDYTNGASAQDYVRYRWAKDFLAGRDTVLKTLYSPLVSEVAPPPSGGTGSPLIACGVIVIASIFLGIFLAFLINALKNIGTDGEAMTKIRSALGKESTDKS
jgi:hypothetical protein